MIYLYKKNIINALEALSDRAFQAIAWYENDKGLCYSYNENISDLFEDSGLEDALKKSGEVVFSNATDQALRELEVMVDAINGRDYTEGMLIDLPQMQAIREKAKHILFLVQTNSDETSTVTMLEPGTAPPTM